MANACGRLACNRIGKPLLSLTLGRPMKTSSTPSRYLNPKRAIDRKQIGQNDNGSWSVIAYNLSEELKIENAQKLLEKFGEYTITKLPEDLQEEAVMLSCCDTTTDERTVDHRGEANLNSHPRPLNDIFLFREGSVVFWGVPYDRQKHILYGISSLKVSPINKDLIQEEREHINYTLVGSRDKSQLSRDVIHLASSPNLKLDQFAFSHAVALSVKLGVWEMQLDEYINSVKWITRSMKTGKVVRKLTKSEVTQKTGEILDLKHSINLSSAILDLPDIYWDRAEQEDVFTSMFAYLSIRERTEAINEKLNSCCELLNLLKNDLNDGLAIRLEVLIVVLITIEVLFELKRDYYNASPSPSPSPSLSCQNCDIEEKIKQ